MHKYLFQTVRKDVCLICVRVCVCVCVRVRARVALGDLASHGVLFRPSLG